MFYYVLLFQHDPRQSLQQLTLLQPNLAADSVAKDVAVLAAEEHPIRVASPVASPMAFPSMGELNHENYGKLWSFKVTDPLRFES